MAVQFPGYVNGPLLEKGCGLMFYIVGRTFETRLRFGEKMAVFADLVSSKTPQALESIEFERECGSI